MSQEVIKFKDLVGGSYDIVPLGVESHVGGFGWVAHTRTVQRMNNSKR
jgi:hypothetical protein